MKSLRAILFVSSVLLNLGLLVWLGCSTGAQSFGNVPRPGNAVTSRFASAGVSKAPGPRPGTNGPTLPDWGRLFSTNLVVYGENLRKVGCPPGTLQVILRAELQRRFSRALYRAYRSIDAQYWDGQALSKTAARRSFRQQHEQGIEQLHRDWETALAGLRAAGLAKESDRFRGDDAREALHLSFLPEDKRIRLAEMERGVEMLRTRLRDQRLDEQEVNRRLDQLRREQDLERQALLTPDEYEEFRLRTSSHASFAMELHGFEPTPEEYRAIVHLLDGLGPSASVDQGREQIRELLGPERFADFERARQPEFRDLHRAASHYELPPGTALELFEQKRLAQQAAASIARRTTWPELERQVVLQELQAATEEIFTGLLGPNGYATYLRNGGRWLRELGQKGGRPASR